MSNPTPPRPKTPSLADYLVRYDLAMLLDEARLDYSQSGSGSPRHMGQKDIAARFSKLGQQPKATDDPR